MSFFNDQKNLNEDELVEFEFNQTEEIYYQLHSFNYDIAPNGGSILLTKNLLSQDKSAPSDEALNRNIMVHSSDGTRFAKLPLPSGALGAAFMTDERILVLKPEGFFLIYNPWDPNCEKTAQLHDLPHKSQFQVNGEYRGIRFMKSADNSFVVFTESNLLFFFYDLESTKIKQLIGRDPDFDLENFAPTQILYFLKPNSKTFIFYIACLKQGLIYLEFEKNIEKQTRILTHITSRITHLNVSFRKKLLSVITEASTLHIFRTDNLTQQFRVELGLGEVERRRLTGIEFIKDHVVVVCFKTYFLLVSRHFEKPLQKKFPSGLNTDGTTAVLLYRSERDGLRILAAKKHSKCLMIRKVSKAYESVKGMISTTPGAALYSNYKSFLKQVPPEDEEIIDNKAQLKRGIEEVLKAARFELDIAKQKKLVLAACHGKVFLEDEDFNNYALYQFCRIIKLWNAMRAQTGRNITCREFEILLSNEFNNLITILVNCRKFELAFHFCTYMEKEKTHINQIFQKWVLVLLAKDEAEEKCAGKILDTFNKVSTINENISSTILIDIAGSALALGKREIAQILLQRENPPLLKIALYINMQQLESALAESLEAYDSNCIYLILNKMLQTWDANEVVDKIAKFNNPVVNEHFYRLLEADQNHRLRIKFAKSLRDPKTFYLKNFKDYLEVTTLKDFSDLSGRNISLLKDTISRTDKIKKGSVAVLENAAHFWRVADESIKNLTSESMNCKLEDVFFPLFAVNKDGYLGNPGLPFDKAVSDAAAKLKLTEKRLVLLRINYMLENLARDKLEPLAKFVDLNKRKGVSLTQLKIIFSAKGYNDEFIMVLETYPPETAFNFCVENYLNYEAALLAVGARSREKFEQVIKKVTDKAKQEKLMAMAASSFK